MRQITEKDIWVFDNWVSVDGIGRIGLYFPNERKLGLDYSMKWIVGTNEAIICEKSDIEKEVCKLFNNKINANTN